MRCLILLFIVSSAMAQPEWGPYEIWSAPADSQIQGTELCGGLNSVHVFFGVGGMHVQPHQLRHAQVSLATPPNIVSDEDLNIATEWTWNFEDATSLNGEWFLATKGWARLNGFQEPYGQNRIDLHSGSSARDTTIALFGGIVAPLSCGGQLTGARFCNLGDSLLGITGYDYDCASFGGWSEPDNIMMGRIVSPAITNWSQFGFGQFGWHGAGTMIAEDSCLFVCENSDNPVVVTFGSDWALASQAPFANCMSAFQPKYLYGLNDTSFVAAVYSEDYNYDAPLLSTLYRVSESGSCSVFRGTGLQQIDDIFFHPDFGFAALQVHHARLFLARIDTTGAEVQPVGILYETDGEHFIVDADVTITDSGQVVAVWSEYTNWGEGPRELKIAWTNWDTFLDTPEQGVPSVPREQTLSAFPNPFNSTATISFDLPNSVPVSLAIFDIQGRLVETLHDETTQAGQHTIAWSPNELSSGVYFARLDAADFSKTAKLLYLK